ncbi:EAL domain-containing protein [Brevibacillus dissolubilis]|uniref:EAL domain-containing protein n=1 Tax=Brevibacillus dissolubilis TaxID=1844116 RepID=UPI0021000ECB|nr:EAL domain-containing protein [Brevibacillus dissolubilis]
MFSSWMDWLSALRPTPFVMSNKKFRLKTTIGQEISRGSVVMLFYVDIVRLTEIENRYGDTAAKRILLRFEKVLAQAAKQIFEIKGKLLAIQKLWGDDFAIYVAFPKGCEEEDFRLLSISFQHQVELMLNHHIMNFIREEMRLHVGYASIPGIDIVKEMYTSVKHAVHMAKYGLTSDKYTYVSQFHRLLNNESVHMLYMPIVSLRDGEPLGWEALARGPEDSPFYSPATLFSYAEETDTVFRLEHICRKRALEQVRFLKPNQKLFINLDPRSIDDPYILRGDVTNMLEELGLAPSNVVFEITERHAISNYAVFRKIIEEYRKKGYLIAVDDAGAGYSSLESIAEIYPDFIKLDMSLIRNIDMDSIKQALLETFVQFADKVKCKIIAEGIETERELETLIELGVSYGQGYYLGKPKKGLTLVDGNAMNFIRVTQDKLRGMDSYKDAYDTPEVAEILTKAVCVERDTKVRQVHQIFEQNQRVESIIILEQDKPVGLLMRTALYRTLGGQYGIPLYYERSVAQIMNKNPLIVRTTDKIDDVARRAMARDTYHLYDVVIICDETGKYLGIVTVQNLLDKMTTIKLELATFANPLTGLPGNVRIEREVIDRMKHGVDFTVIYCDLDKFKYFNDQHGFEVGDQIISRTAQMLRECIRDYGNKTDFIGHIGGDDFIMITTPDRVHLITDYIISTFSTYFADIMSKCSRAGENPPSLTMSMAGVYYRKGSFQSVEAIAERAASIKKIAKKSTTTNYISDAILQQQTVSI